MFKRLVVLIVSLVALTAVLAGSAGAAGVTRPSATTHAARTSKRAACARPRRGHRVTAACRLRIAHAKLTADAATASRKHRKPAPRPTAPVKSSGQGTTVTTPAPTATTTVTTPAPTATTTATTPAPTTTTTATTPTTTATTPAPTTTTAPPADGSSTTGSASSPTSWTTPADHISTWAYDDCGDGGANASATEVRAWVTFAESNCGPTGDAKALSDCHSGSTTFCDVIQYLDTNWIYQQGSPPWASLEKAASESWYLHAPGSSSTRVGISSYGGGYLLDQSNVVGAGLLPVLRALQLQRR